MLSLSTIQCILKKYISLYTLNSRQLKHFDILYKIEGHFYEHEALKLQERVIDRKSVDAA